VQPYFGLLTDMNVGFACGSMVHVDLCFQNICTKCKCFGNTDGIFDPAGGGISRRVNDRVTRVTYRRYTVRTVPAWCRPFIQVIPDLEPTV